MTLPMSKFRIMTQPSQAAAVMVRQQERIAELERENEGLRAQALELRSDIATLKKERSALQAANTESELRLHKAEQDYEQLQKEIDEVRIMFEKVSDMKHKYDRRIERYKGMIADLERALERERRATADNDIIPIKSIAPTISPKPAPTPEIKSPNDNSGDWYLPLEL